MTETEAADVATFAKRLFPVTTQERIDALGVMLTAFPNPSMARQCLQQHAQQSEVLSIPAVRSMLQAIEDSADRRRDAARRSMDEYRQRVEQQRTYYDAQKREVDEALDGRDLEQLKADTLEAATPDERAFLARHDARTNRALRALMAKHVRGQRDPVPEPSRAMVPAHANAAADFEVE